MAATSQMPRRRTNGYNLSMTLLRLRTGIALLTSFFVLTVG